MRPFLTVSCSEVKVNKVRQLTQIFCLLSFQDITNRELDLLCHFIYCGGVNDKAKKAFMVEEKTSAANYGQLVRRLSDKNILVNKKHRTGKSLHPDFEKLKEFYVDEDGQNILVIKILK